MKLRQQTLVYFVAALMVAACVSTVEAQGRRGQGGQGGRGGFQPGGGQGGRGGFQPGGGQGGRGGFQPGGGFGMMGGGAEVQLLTRADVRRELELIDDQVKDLEGLRDGMDMRSMFEGVEGLRDMSQEQRREKMQEVMQAAQKKTQAKINDILLPHQATRLKQLAVQLAMQRGGGVSSGTVAEQLGISEEQREKLREKTRKLQEEMQKKIQQELLKELTPAQQAKLKQLTGEPFTFEQTAPQPGGGRGGAPGAGVGRRRGN